MGTDKRERQKAGRAARVEAAEAARQRAQGRRRVYWVVGTIVFAIVVVGVAALLLRDDDSSETAATTTTLSPSATPSTLASVEGQPCVEFSDTLPPGAPPVPIVAGPPPTALQTTDLVEGTGEVVPAGATITVDYIGASCSTGTIFDASYGTGQPATFPLDGVIDGWTQGIPGMKVGGQRLLVIPPDQAYGDTGAPGGGIAPGETLWFVVEVKDIATNDPSSPGG
jgi:peptidylprolyl isomerase